MNTKEILDLLPYTSPFLFVDELFELTGSGIKGNYTYRKDEYFYRGHFKNNPVTPGVILTETMAQIGVVCFGIYLLKDTLSKTSIPEIALSSVEIDFIAPVFPGEKVTVISQKKYFRFNKLKCEVEMRNSLDKIVCSGTLSGIIKYRK
jgi:3-hydroxyacyl-[acyl-carrier-protein] dehydratase